MEPERGFTDAESLIALLNHLPCLVYVCRNDRSWTMLHLSEGCREVTGYEPRQLIGNRERSYNSLIHPEDREEVRRLVLEGLANNGVFHASYRILAPDGSVRWVQESGRGTQRERGAYRRLEGVIIDVTERRRLEASLELQVKRLRLLNDIAFAGVHDMDPTSFLRGILELVERSFPGVHAALLVYEEQENAFRPLLAGPRGGKVARRLGYRETGVIPVSETGLGPCMQGEHVYIPDTAASRAPHAGDLAQADLRSLLAVPIQMEEKPFGVLLLAERPAAAFSPERAGFYKNLCEHLALALRQKQLTEDLQRSYQDLQATRKNLLGQERLKALGEMASGIAHDINNTLSPIVGFTDLLLMKGGNLTERQVKSLKIIRTAANDISAIVERMREFYRPRGEGDKLDPVQLNDAVRSAVELTAPKWKDLPQRQGVTVTIRTEVEDRLTPVMGVESEIREAVINLISNAVDAMSWGGTLTFRTYKKRRTVFLEVRDDGEGMDRQTRERCLEPFFTTKQEGAGTGLGLSVVYGAMQRHGGDLEIESAPGEGTTVRLVFPLYPRTGDEAVPAPAEEVRPSRPLRVLLIDDDPLVRELMREMLEGDGHRTEVAETGKTGLQCFADSIRGDGHGERFDAVITDLGMPDMDGRRVARGVKRMCPDTPVILLSGWTQRSVEKDQQYPEMDYTLKKPPKILQLRRALAAVESPKDGASRT
jgi:PAS domain S-box-containing protein